MVISMIDICKSISKEGVGEFGLPDKSDMEKISAYTKKELSPEEIFVFTVTLCDNDIDRDGERFTEDCIRALVPLMVGRTGICDHDPRAKNQAARLFDCRAVVSETEKNRLGQPLMRLEGRAYMLRTAGMKETIAQIEGGIRKEVSISCSVKKQTCSVCGKDIRTCGHIRGRDYGNGVCYAQLSEPVDGYEWSFVAVPAQKNAGVTKSRKEVKDMGESADALFVSIREGTLLKCEGSVTLTAAEAVSLSDEIHRLSALAEYGRQHTEELRKEVKRLGILAGLSLPEKTGDSIFEKMSVEELGDMKKSLERICKKQFPVKPQTMPENTPTDTSELDGFKI